MPQHSPPSWLKSCKGALGEQVGVAAEQAWAGWQIACPAEILARLP